MDEKWGVTPEGLLWQRTGRTVHWWWMGKPKPRLDLQAPKPLGPPDFGVVRHPGR
jgi:hypothetical protein